MADIPFHATIRQSRTLSIGAGLLCALVISMALWAAIGAVVLALT
jgi:hypothetical protein